MGATSISQFQVAWGDLDANGHMANRAFLDYATQARFLYIAERGFTPLDFRKHSLGPVILEEHIRYIKELLFLERFRVDFSARLLSDDGSRFRLRNRFFREDDRHCAEIVCSGAWFCLRTRTIVPPPPPLAEAMQRAPVFDDEP